MTRHEISALDDQELARVEKALTLAEQFGDAGNDKELDACVRELLASSPEKLARVLDEAQPYFGMFPEEK